MFLTAFLSRYAQSPLFANAFALILNTGATAVLGMVYWVLAARLYTASDVGLGAAAISAMTFLAGVAQLNLAAVMVRFLPSARRDAARLVASTYLVIAGTALLVAGIFVASLTLWFSSLRFLRDEPWLGVWFVLSTMCWCVFVNQDGVLTGLRRTSWVPIENIAYGILKIILLVAFASFGYRGLYASWTLPVLFVVLPVNVLIFRRFIPLHERGAPVDAVAVGLRQIRGYIAGDYIGSLLRLATTFLPPVLVTQILGAQMNGYFYQSWNIAYNLQLVSTATMTSLTVESVWDKSTMRESRWSILKHTLLLVGVGVAGILVLAPFVLRIFGEDYAAEGTTLLRLLALAAIPQVIVAFALALARIRQHVIEVVAIQAVSCGFVLGLGLILLRTYGLNGIGIAWLVGQTILAFLLAFRLRRLYSGDQARTS
ncbi:MAG: oligosaccharide flippase family protein [Chloroflexota bacterium]|nr:oligosaccharide flippase family protein [Chloroflexota bacterium]